MKNLFEQLLEKAGANAGIQVIQGNFDEILAQLRAEADTVAENVGKVATSAVDTGTNVIQQLIADLNAQFGGQEGVEINHRGLTIEEMGAELLAMLGDVEEDDDRTLEDMSNDELIELVLIQDETLELATEALETLRGQGELKDAQLAAQEELLNLQSKLLDDANTQLTAMHEGVAQLRGLMETLKGTDNRTRVVSFADLINGLGKR